MNIKHSKTILALQQVAIIIMILVINLSAFVKIDSLFMITSILFLFLMIYLRSWILIQYFLCISFFKLYLVFPSFVWNIPAMMFLIPFLISTLIILPFPQARVSLAWFKRGKIDIYSFILIILTAIAAAAALITWGYWSQNLGVGAQVMKSLSAYPSWLVLSVFLPVFALINAFAEEAVYRGVIQQGLGDVFKNKYVVIILLQASAFAAAHVAFGFPNGKIGYGMTFCYACVLGYLRLRTKGILAPYITHVLADLVIAYFLYSIIL